jgi:type IX secretion system PorP/SprF family membrane protein
MRKQIYFSILAVALAAGTRAQQLPLFSQYYYNPFIYNPAFAGVEEETHMYLIHRSQWKDMPGAPTTYALTADGPVRSNEIGIGLSLFNDQTDIFNRTGLYSSYSYRIPISSDHQFTVGLSGGIIDNKIDFSRASVSDDGDPLLYNTNRRKITMDATFGIGYFWQDLRVGFSIPQLLGNKINYSEVGNNVFTINERHYLLSAAYKVTISETNEIDALPSMMLRYVPGAPFQFDINANFAWKDMIRAGLSYRHGYAIGFNVGTKINKNLIAGYTYEYVLSPLGSISGGGHELMLGFVLGKKKDDDKIVRLEQDLEQVRVEKDSLGNELKRKDAEHTNEINKLKQEMETIKKDNSSGSTNTNGTGNPTNTNTTGVLDNTFRKELAADYVDEFNKPILPGYYIIIGAYKVKDNAVKAKTDFGTKEGMEPIVMYNNKRGFYYVCVFKTSDEESAQDVVEVVKKIRTDAWVFVME